MNQDVKALKAQGKTLKPIITIGKEGMSDNSLENIRKNLVANKLTKIKFSKAYLDSVEESKKELAADIAKQLKAEIIEVVGFVVVLYKR